MTISRRYSVAEVKEFVDLLRNYGENVTPEQIAGMDLIVGILKEFEHMTDADIEAKIKAEWHRF
jgi:hypothetical protein